MKKYLMHVTFFVSIFALLLTSYFIYFVVSAHEFGDEDSVIVHMTPNGFEPKEITIERGQKVIFENDDTVDRWPATNIHPTHRLYPDSDINDCNTPKEKYMFDACREIKPNGTYTFQFNHVGKWRLHDHILPQHKGVINVVEANDDGLVVEDGGDETKEKDNFITRIWKAIINFFISIWNALFGAVDPEIATDNEDVVNEKIEYENEIKELAENADDSIAKDSTEIFNDKGKLFSYVKKYGAAQALQHLHNLSSTFGSCHNAAHDVGRSAYEIDGGKAFQDCTAECHSGCYHGATEAFFRDNGTSNLLEDLDFLCPVGDLNNFYDHQCIHGVGHGLMAFADYDIHEALDACETMPRRVSSCYSGVFMENIVGGLAADQGHFTEFLSDDPHFPCNILDEKYVRDCYFMQTSQMIRLSRGDFKTVAENCAAIDPKYQETCFTSMGRDVGGYKRSPWEEIAECRHAPEPDQEQWCLSGAVQDNLWDPSGVDNSIAFCTQLTGNQKSSCYGIIIPRAIEVIFDEQGLEDFCSKVELEFQEICFARIK